VRAARLPQVHRGDGRLGTPTLRLGLGRGVLVASIAAALLVLAQAASAASRVSGLPNESGIVDIDTTLGFEQGSAAGTGLVLSPSGEVLTNNHVIRGAASIRVVEPGTGRTYAATVVGYDVGSDVAVIQITHAADLQTVALGNSAAAKIGAAVIAVGNAGGVGGPPTVTRGKIVALHQSISVSDDEASTEQLSGLTETNAALQPGDSGGPLLNASGEVIGMDTAASTGFGFQPGISSQGYAIPIDHALTVAGQIEAGRSSSAVHIGATPFLGVDVSSPRQSGFGFGGDSANPGAFVVAVVPSSPAQKAGLGEGDVITSLDGRKIKSVSSVTGAILEASPGSVMGVGWLDASGKAHSARVRLATGPPQ
jgi:S1-C subfamily serine protease